MIIDIVSHPICLKYPARLSSVSAWQQHIPFAMYLMDIQRPGLFVELGTHYGDSYCAFCQAVKELKINTACYAIDTWKGDPQAGYYGADVLEDLRLHHDSLYGCFSSLLQSTFDEAVSNFTPGSIDLLHIDGYHTYEAVKHDFETWKPMMSNRGIVLFHDINEHREGYGAWRFWEEIKKMYPHFHFLHGHGLGVLAVGPRQPSDIESLCNCSDEEIATIRNLFGDLGQLLTSKEELKRVQIQPNGVKSVQLKTKHPKRVLITVSRWAHSLVGNMQKKLAIYSD